MNEAKGMCFIVYKKTKNGERRQNKMMNFIDNVSNKMNMNDNIQQNQFKNCLTFVLWTLESLEKQIVSK